MINGLYAYNGTDKIRRLANYAELSVAGDWNSTDSYFSAASEVVYVANATYIAIRNNTNSYPLATTGLTNPACWSPLVLLSVLPSEAISRIIIGGNTAGTTQDINGILMLAGGNNITISQQSNTFTFIGGAGGGGGGGAAISAGANSQSTGTVVFSNSNGISFGLSNNGKLTASYTVPNTAGLISAIKLSAGTSSNNLSAVTFSNSNGVSFGLNANSIVTASVQTNYQTPGAYLTTAMQSDAATLSNINVSAANASANLSNLAFGNAGGVSFVLIGSTVAATVRTDYQSAGPYLTTAMQSNAATISNVKISAGTASSNISALTFSDGGGVSFGFDGSNITATVATNYQSQGAYLTTAMQSQSSSVFAKTGFTSTTTGGTAVVGTHDTNGLSLGVPAFITTAMQSNAATISNINVSGGASSLNLSAITFANSNGVSFGLSNNSVLTATVATNYQSQGAYLTTAMQSQSSSVFAKTGFTSTTTGGTAIVATHDTNGLSMGVPAFLTTAMQSNAATISNINVSGGSTSSNLSAVTFSNANGVSFGLGTGASVGVLTASVNPGVANINLSAGTTSTNAAAFTFVNSNGVSFGLGTGASAGQVTATVQTNFLTTAAQSTQTLQFTLGGNVATTNSSQVANGGFILAGGNNLTIQQSNNTLSFSVGNYITTADLSQNSSKYAGTNGAITGGSITVNTSGVSVNLPAYLTTAMQSNAATISNINVSAGTTSTNASAFSFVDSNGVSFGLGTGASVGRVTATVATNYQSQGAYLTTAAQSSQTLQFTLGGNVATTNSSQIANGGFVLAGGNSLTIQQSNNTISLSVGNYITTADLSQNSSKYAGINSGATNCSVTVNTSGVSVALPAYLTTAALSSQTLAISLSGNTATTNSSQILNGGYALAGGNNVTLQQSNNTVSISVGNYITTAALSTQTLVFSLGGNSATTNSSQISNGGFVLAGGNSLTIQQSNNTISLSVGNYITTADLSQNSSKYAGINSGATNCSVTVNTSGVSVALPAYLTTAAQSTQTLQFTLGGNVATTNSSQIANGGFILAGGNNLTIQQSNNTVSLSVGNYITTADLSQNSSNYAGVGETVGTVAGTDLAMTVNTAGVSIAYPKWITTAALSSQTLALSLGGNSATTNSSQIINGGYVLAGGANVTIQQSNNTISISAAAAAAAPINFSAGTTSNNIGSVVFSNSNNLLFGLNGSTITASYSNIDIGISTNGNTAGTTGTFDGGGLQYVFAGTNGITLSQSSNGASVTLSVVGPGDPYCGYLEPMSMTNTAVFGPAAGNWYFAPFEVPQKMSGGRLNLLHINTSTASLFIDITGASYVSGSTGTLQQSYTYSKAVALYSQGAGTNSTRLESIWSNSFSFGWSKDVRVSLSNASNINITVAHSLSYISEIGSNGAYTLNQFASAISTTVANSSTASNQFTNAGSSIRNMLSNSIIEPIGFNTTIAPGAYWLAFAWSSTRATASTGGLLGSAPDFSVSSEVGISRLVLESAFRNWGSTNTTARSHIMPYGLFTGAANMAPPSTLAFSSDLSSIASAWVPYFNFQNQGITK